MWRRIYVLLLLVRIYFALKASYLHPDEIFQGPEIIAGSLFPYPSHKTWEWTSSRPIRSVFPLWIVYGIPMSLLKSVWTNNDGLVDPATLYYCLRLIMFILSLVLEDWAIYELVHSPKRRQRAVLLVASSYVTWTFQTHTFSNSIETLIVLWSLVLIDRIVKLEHRTSFYSCTIFGFLLIFGFFNRITFPAFVLIPSLRLVPHFIRRPFSLVAIVLSVVFWLMVAVAMDTTYYSGPAATTSFRALFNTVWRGAVVTPLNNIIYNTKTKNLAEHGLHPHYQHVLVNLPQLLGPALILLVTRIPECAGSKIKAMLANPRLTSAATGTLMLSVVPHQESRFLLACVPLLLTCVELPRVSQLRKYFWSSWVIFNVVFGILMGIYHQGGIVPAQIAIPDIVQTSLQIAKSKSSNIDVYWWKTYPPPTYLIGSNHVNPVSAVNLNISSEATMGVSQALFLEKVANHLPQCQSSLLDRVSDVLSRQREPEVYVVAPLSAWRLPENQRMPSTSNFTFQQGLTNDVATLKFEHLATFRQHINLDDMDFGEDGIISTISRVIGRRGLGVWHVEKSCTEDSPTDN